MYLKKIEINNFRKFRSENNIVHFVDSETYQNRNSKEKINIATSTTLIVGKNNSGKTTIIKALEKLISENKYDANDFNFFYLKEKLNEYKVSKEKDFSSIELPHLEFKITVGLEKNNKDLITNLVPFMTLGNIENSEFDILIRYEVEERQIFESEIKELLRNEYHNDSHMFKDFVELVNNTKTYKTNYYNASGDKVKFRIRDLIEIKTIKANNVSDDQCLSRAFSKIVEYRYKSSHGVAEKNALEEKIQALNNELSTNFATTHTTGINASLEAIESKDKLEMHLSSNLTFNKLITDLIKYEYVEQGLNIPETQFGLGYTNLMMIIADLIEYMEKYPEQSFTSKVNLISIEEPETFMHPQMQEMFISHINKAVSSLLKGKQKDVNSQLIITTHSSHILNSKVHSGNTFDNINYITTLDNTSVIIPLNDEIIAPDGKTKNDKKKNLMFLKKHIKFKVSELFFSDAVIFVEGVTEETLLRYYISKDDFLNKQYISIFNIDGAHGLVYHKLIKEIKVPSLIITDLDILRSKVEKDNYEQITCLDKKQTTNQTLIKYNNNLKDLKTIISEEIIEGNLKISYQNKINGYYATSFEEAFILTNYNNIILNTALQKVKPDVYKCILGEGVDFKAVSSNSYKLQRKLSSSKSDFANTLLFELITSENEEENPVLPDYIQDGLTWLISKLKK